MKPAAIVLDHVSVELAGQSILEDLQAEIESDCLTAVMGPNGAGKTTLLHAILGLLPYRGRILFGKNRSEKRPRIGYVPQRLDLDRGTPITVRDFLLSALTNRPLWIGSTRNATERCVAALEHTGALSVFNSSLGKISGGETQRVLLAQALLGDPEILILDEPVAAVDVAGGALFCDILEEVQKARGITTLLVSHDLSVVTTHARNALCLNRRLICAGPIEQVLTTERLREVFSPHVNVYDHSHTHPPVRNPSNGRTG